MTLKEYAKKRKVSTQAVQRAIAKEQVHLLPGVTAINKVGRIYSLTVVGKVTTGRSKKYFK